MTPGTPAAPAETAPETAPGTAPESGRPPTAPRHAEALVERLDRLRHRVADLVDHRAADDPTAGEPLRGLYLSDHAVRYLLHGDRHGVPDRAAPDGDHPPTAPDAPAVEAVGGPPGRRRPAVADRLGALAARCGLSALDTAILLLALAPEVDRDFEGLYGYLNDDVSRRRATVGLALDLCGAEPHDADARARLHPAGPLASLGLVEIEDPERPFLGRGLRVPERLVSHLLGDDTPDSTLAPHLRTPPPSHAGTEGVPALLSALLGRGPATVYLREHREGDGLGCALAALRATDAPTLCYDGPAEYARELLREARLLGAAVVLPALPEKPAELLATLVGQDDVTVLVADKRPYDPQWCRRDPLVVDAPRRAAAGVLDWSAALGPAGDHLDLAVTVAPYRLGGERVHRAARAALDLAHFEGVPLDAGHLRRAARQQSASGLEQHARRIRPDVDWGDLVLPDRPLTDLRELASRARHRELVLGDWRLSAGGGRGRGVLGMFAGESGTGKTLSAEVVAAELGLDLYVVQLSSVVDKYVGETEKNLERIFTEADRTDAVLLFDEADAVFGKRSEVKDSHDRYANLESAYLLQRLESFDGIALLTTNLRSNIDDAFTRRLDMVVDFPFPDAAQRLALWHHGLKHVPRVDGIRPEALADTFELAGGSIRSAVVTAAYLAATRGEQVTQEDLLEGARREYRKAGRLVPGEGNW